MFCLLLRIRCWSFCHLDHQGSRWLWINRCILAIDTKTNPQTSVTWPPNIQTSSSTSTPASLEDPCKFACIICFLLLTPSQFFSFNQIIFTGSTYLINFHFFPQFRSIMVQSSCMLQYYFKILTYCSLLSLIAMLWNSYRFQFFKQEIGFEITSLFSLFISANFNHCCGICRGALVTSRVHLICQLVGEVKRGCVAWKHNLI